MFRLNANFIRYSAVSLVVPLSCLLGSTRKATSMEKKYSTLSLKDKVVLITGPRLSPMILVLLIFVIAVISVNKTQELLPVLGNLALGDLPKKEQIWY